MCQNTNFPIHFNPKLIVICFVCFTSACLLLASSQVSSCCAATTTDACRTYCQQVNEISFFNFFIRIDLLFVVEENGSQTSMTSFIHWCLFIELFILFTPVYPVSWLSTASQDICFSRQRHVTSVMINQATRIGPWLFIKADWTLVHYIYCTVYKQQLIKEGKIFLLKYGERRAMGDWGRNFWCDRGFL